MIDRRRIRIAPDLECDLYTVNTLVIGSGAAALNGALHLHQFLRQRGINPSGWIAIATDALGAGTSRFSGSDKQTYYKLGTSSRVADSPRAFAETLTRGGCMHGDIALAEGENSLREFYHLVDLGVPFPHTPEGAHIGYKTDHDPLERGTSAGPKTSNYMFQCLLAAVRRAGIPIFNHHDLLDLVVAQEDGCTTAIGAVTLDRREIELPHHGLAVWNAGNILACTGGPGSLYETSVYPQFLRGNHAALFRAGAVAHNLSESQFGLASVGFRWNLSGTYQQVIPRYYSTEPDGSAPREFLNPFFPSMRRMATSVFLKGYQWPFDPQRLPDHQSSLVDMLVFHERSVLGRRVFMDFRRNPVATHGLSGFSLEDLEPEARVYLEKSGGLQHTPIERLAHMNPLAIDLYREHGIDLWKAPLEIAVCSQHNNGGFAVNPWWETTVKHLFAAGELAGTHGVKRPGGSSLNSTQVGSLRAAEYIAHRYADAIPAPEDFRGRAEKPLAALLEPVQALAVRGAAAALRPEEAAAQIRARMSLHAAHVRSLDGVRGALGEAMALRARIDREGLRFESLPGLRDALFVRSLALTSVAYLEAIRSLLERGGGSRGSHLVVHPGGDPIHPMLPASWRILPENEALRGEILEIWLAGSGEFLTRARAVRPIPGREYWFETLWADYRSGRIFEM